jgi:hypothetical protein
MMVKVSALDPARVDALLQFVLAVAACEDDFKDRELGPIHLIKYVYLADVAHAERHGGEPFTGAPWRFHHFGPWSAEVFARIEPALTHVGAQGRRVSSSHADDFVRYRLDRPDAERVRSDLEAVLPMVVQSRLSSAIHEFGSDTASLLRTIYLSPPMVNAAPDERLDFATAVREPRTAYRPAERTLTSRERRERARRVEEIRAEVQKRLAIRGTRGGHAEPSPRYDTVFREGVDWLDRLAGEDVSPASGDLAIADDVWKSDARRDPDVP